MRAHFIFVLFLLAAVPAAAFQIGDGYNNDTYNGHAYNLSDGAFKGIIAKGSGGVPVGTIIAWPVASNPEDMENWLECNGQAISASAYPELRSLIGTNVPDLRGLFLRGNGSQTHTQNNGSTIGVTSTTHSSGTLGQIQGDAIRNAEGSSGTFQGFSDANYVGALTRLSFWFHGSINEDNPGWYAHKFGIDLSRVVPTANENRPVNMSVRYLIRALP